MLFSLSYQLLICRLHCQSADGVQAAAHALSVMVNLEDGRLKLTYGLTFWVALLETSAIHKKL